MKNLKNNLYYVLTKIENPRTEISTKRIKKFHRYKAHIEIFIKTDNVIPRINCMSYGGSNLNDAIFVAKFALTHDLKTL